MSIMMTLTRGPLLIEELSNPIGREVRMATIEYPPGQEHRAAPPCGRDLRIRAFRKCDRSVGRRQRRIKYGPGEAWTEQQPGAILHEVSPKRELDLEPAKLLVLMITDPEKAAIEF